MADINARELSTAMLKDLLRGRAEPVDKLQACLEVVAAALIEGVCIVASVRKDGEPFALMREMADTFIDQLEREDRVNRAMKGRG